MKVDKFVGNLWIQLNYLRGFSDALQHPALAEFIEETVELIDKFEKEWTDEQADAEAEEGPSESTETQGGGVSEYLEGEGVGGHPISNGQTGGTDLAGTGS